MSNPRLVVGHGEIGWKRKTFKIDNSTITFDKTKIGGSASVPQTGALGYLAVTLSADDTVALAADGDAILGALELVEGDNFATVITEGEDIPLRGGTSATLTLGATIVGALLSAAKGYIRSAASGTAAELVKARGQILNNDDTSKVIVKL